MKRYNKKHAQMKKKEMRKGPFGVVALIYKNTYRLPVLLKRQVENTALEKECLRTREDGEKMAGEMGPSQQLHEAKQKSL